MNRNICRNCGARVRRALDVLELGALALLAGCGETSGTAGTSDVEARLDVRTVARGTLAPGDTLSVRISGQGMEPVLKRGSFARTVEFEGLPPGEARTVEGWVTDAAARRLYYGFAERDLAAGSNEVALELDPLFADLVAALPLGSGNPMGVAGGVLVLARPGDTVRAPLEVGPVRGTFSATRVLFADDWTVSVRVWSASGDTLYSLDAPFPVDPSAREISLDLSSTQAGVSLVIELKEPGEVRASLSFPGRARRAVEAPGEVVFSELFPFPKSSGDDWEWMELANATPDTLLLSGCAVAKSRGSSAASTRLELPDLEILPGDVVVLGRDSVDFADWNYQAFNMANTRQLMLLLCGQAAIDSVEYMPATDPANPFPVEERHSLELDPAKVGERTLGSSWCRVDRELEMRNLTAAGTPGRWEECPD